MKNRLKVGQIVSEERLTEIQLESEKNTAFDKALTHLSATRKTEKQIREYLTKKGYLPAVIDYVTEKLRSYNFLNDSEYAEAYVESVAKHKGGRLIRMELRGKGVSDSEIDAALEERLGSDREEEAAKDADKTTMQKAYRYLMGKGFDYDVAKAALSSYGSCEDGD